MENTRKYSICKEKLNISKVLGSFSNLNDEIENLLKNFVDTHNSSIFEKSGTTYEIFSPNKDILGYFVLNFGSLNKNSKNKLFFKKNNLTHDYYPVINLEFLIRKPGEEYLGLGEEIFISIFEIISHI
ncbi:MAG: hypothetical protein Q9M94_07280, partial [Candidatus Gracilibacteria bacterium]|nr:hypothetical protein [Candidatus Gracilibacteria bacterium]